MARGGVMGIRGRLITGFAAVGLVFVGMVAFTIQRTEENRSVVDQMVRSRVPSALAGQKLAASIYGSLERLRAYIAVREPGRLRAWEASWVRIHSDKDVIAQQLSSAHLTDLERQDWEKLTTALNPLEEAQKAVVAILGTPEEAKGMTIFTEEAQPLMARTIQMARALVEEEARLPDGGPRKALMETLATIRGEAVQVLASLQTYLMTGDEIYKTQYDSVWKNFSAQVQKLDAQQELMTGGQRMAIGSLKQLMQQIDPLAAQLMTLRQGDAWNQADFLLNTKVTPLVERLMDRLEGREDAMGLRSGGFVTVQSRMVELEADQVATSAQDLRQTLIVLLISVIMLTVLIVIATQRGIVPPLTLMTEAMTQLANGKLNIKIPALERTDEVGRMAAAVQVFKDNAERVQAMELEAEERNQRLEDEKRLAMTNMANEFEESVAAIVTSVSNAAQHMRSSAEHLSSTASQALTQTHTVAEAAEQGSQNVQTVASAAEELTSSIQEISRQVTEATRVAQQAVTEAGTTDAGVQKLATAAVKIDDVVRLIQAIAEQTNLLALNATIEAARAGEAGRGFAVVANEVKALASQTAKATEDIQAQIGAIQRESSHSVKAIQSVSVIISSISDITAAVAAAVEQQGAATREITRNVQQAADGSRLVSDNITAVRSTAEATGASAAEVLTVAGDLSHQAAFLQSAVQSFVARVRA
ncbi:MAG: methyl-accepting chemotaxis protein [Elstera sp.]